MASRRFASVITFSPGTNTNSASLSTNFLMSHGQATRSTLTFSRVIHFMLRLPYVYVARASRVRKDDNSAMRGRNDVQPVRWDQHRRMRVRTGHGLYAVTGARIDG